MLLACAPGCQDDNESIEEPPLPAPPRLSEPRTTFIDGMHEVGAAMLDEVWVQRIDPDTGAVLEERVGPQAVLAWGPIGVYRVDPDEPNSEIELFLERSASAVREVVGEARKRGVPVLILDNDYETQSQLIESPIWSGLLERLEDPARPALHDSVPPGEPQVGRTPRHEEKQ